MAGLSSLTWSSLTGLSGGGEAAHLLHIDQGAQLKPAIYTHILETSWMAVDPCHVQYQTFDF